MSINNSIKAELYYEVLPSMDKMTKDILTPECGGVAVFQGTYLLSLNIYKRSDKKQF